MTAPPSPTPAAPVAPLPDNAPVRLQVQLGTSGSGFLDAATAETFVALAGGNVPYDDPRLFALAEHPEELVPWLLVTSHANRFARLRGGPRAIEQAVCGRALADARAEGRVWTPLLDALDGSGVASPSLRDGEFAERAQAVGAWVATLPPTTQTAEVVYALLQARSATVRAAVVRATPVLTLAIVGAAISPHTVASALVSNQALVGEIRELATSLLVERMRTEQQIANERARNTYGPEGFPLEYQAAVAALAQGAGLPSRTRAAFLEKEETGFVERDSVSPTVIAWLAADRAASTNELLRVQALARAEEATILAVREDVADVVRDAAFAGTVWFHSDVSRQREVNGRSVADYRRVRVIGVTQRNPLRVAKMIELLLEKPDAPVSALTRCLDAAPHNQDVAVKVARHAQASTSHWLTIAARFAGDRKVRATLAAIPAARAVPAVRTELLKSKASDVILPLFEDRRPDEFAVLAPLAFKHAPKATLASLETLGIPEGVSLSPTALGPVLALGGDWALRAMRMLGGPLAAAFGGVTQENVPPSHASPDLATTNAAAPQRGLGR